MAKPDLKSLTVVGPFWTADVDVVSLDAPDKALALRRLFIDTTPRKVAGVDKVLAPGTLIALCVARRVRVRPADGDAALYEWRRLDGAALPPLATGDQLRAAVQSGAVSLLLLAADPSAWSDDDDDDPPPLTCLAGDIALDALQPRDNAVSRLYGALGLAPPPAASVRAPGALSAHASGLSILGAAALPWLPQASERVTAPLLLARVLPPPDVAAPAFRLTIEAERLRDAERAALVAAAQRLSRAINPRYPLNQPPDDTAEVPQWATLELVNPNAPPRLFWPIATWGSLGRLSFERGEVNLLLSDRQPYRADGPPASLARALPETVTIERAPAGALTIVVRAGAMPPAPAAGLRPDGATYAYTAGPAGEETLRLAEIKTSFSPVETPTLLRVDQGLSVPEWSNDGGAPLAEPVVWGFAPLEDGWAQLPFPNLSEQIYLDAGLAQPDALRSAAPQASFMQGAVSFSGLDGAGAPADPTEHPWSVTIADAPALEGTWTLAPAGEGYALATISLALARPDLTLNGFFWLSRGAPTPEDALPDFDDWVGGLHNVPLRRVRTRAEGATTVAADLFPSLLVLRVEVLTLHALRDSAASARLATWSLALEADNPQVAIARPGANPGDPPVVIVTTLAARLFGGDPATLMPPPLPADLFSRHEALLWRRHPALPAAHALPLTQSKEPPNAPSASRQLAPFALATRPTSAPLPVVPHGWRLGVAVAPGGATNGAATWPRMEGAAQPAAEWRRLSDLPLAALSLPGLTLDPSAHAASGLEPSLLPLRYRYDLPYSDEVQALAQLPKVRRPPDEVSPLPDEPPLAPPRPLFRDTYAEHWRRLSERASLAAADAVDALSADDGQPFVRHLVEPLAWPVAPAADLSAYPGELRLAEPGAPPESAVVLRGATTAPDAAGSADPALSDAALRGISGRFAQRGAGGLGLAADADAAPFVVHAGSMEAYRNADGSFRDQRSLSRFASDTAGQLLETLLRLDEADGAHEVTLTSALAPCALEIAAGQGWQLWFRDLPLQAGSFAQAATRSPAAQDANDPEATAREYSHRAAYEWRLADVAPLAGAAPALRLCGLHFHPLALDRLDAADGLVGRVELIGRLQLPLSQRPAEIVGLSNAVRATFVRQGDALTLASVALEPSGEAQPALGEWPLALTKNELGDAPRIVWGGVAFDPAAGALTLSDARLCFYLFNVEWRVPIAAGSARFTAADAVVTPTLDLPADDGPLAAVAAVLELNLAAAAAAVGDDKAPVPVAHRATLDLALRLGRALAAPADPAASRRTAFAATLRYTLLAPAAPQLVAAALFDDIVLQAGGTSNATLELSAHERALQFAWGHWQNVPAVLDLLPGMPLVGNAAPGCAAATFVPVGRPGGVPQLDVQLAFVEAALEARWGEFMQRDASGERATPQQVYGSSAGEVTFGYTAHAVREGAAVSWDEGFLLNGFIEVKSLISWPASMRLDAAGGALTLPPALENGAVGPLSHTRHTMRVLLNQHQIPPALVLLAADPALLFDLAPAAPWQTIAVVEHQLLDVYDDAQPDGALRLGPDRRWAAPQEVRLMAPGVLRAFLQAYSDPALRTVDPVAGLAPLTAGGEGYFAPELRALLLAELDARAALGPCLLVEASAPHWLRVAALEEDARPTALQYLPGGSQHAILSGPADFAPPEPNAGWLLLSTPFLGRIQPAAADAIDAGAAGAGAGPLAVDPILALRRALGQSPRPPHAALALAFTHRGDEAGVEVRPAALDTAAGRTWARLDPLALLENWGRLQAPFAEPEPERLPSVLAALPDTPARASRSVALRRAFDTFRPFVPPADIGAYRLPGNDDFRYELPPETIDAQIVWREHSLLAPNSRLVARSGAGQRVTSGLQVLYTFSEGGGDFIVDVSGVGAPLNLRITEQDDIEWLAGGGLKLTAPTLFRSEAPAAKLIAACKASNAITLEAWVRPESATQHGPARIISLSKDDTQRNVSLEQGLKSGTKALYNARLRTSQTSANGLPSLATPPGSASTSLTHLVFTRAADGTARLYVDGVAQPPGQSGSDFHNGTLGGTFVNWNDTYELALANELNRGREWRGEFYLVAAYSRALSAAEVQQNFRARGAAGAPVAWHATAALLASSGLAGAQADEAPALRRHPAATLLPARLKVTLTSGGATATVANAQPLGFAVSPYLGLAQRRAPALTTRLLVAAELVCVDPPTGRLRPAATRVFEAPQPPEGETDPLPQQVLGWAREQHRLLAPESPVALLRLRTIARRASNAPPETAAEEAALVTSYGFMLVGELDLPVRLALRVARLRTPARQLRFREGQYGGSALPAAPALFELAPPLVTGAQPIYLTERPNAPGGDARWPWGTSALRFSVQYTAARHGAAGASAGPATLWWQAIQHAVQYRSTLHPAPLFALDPTLEGALVAGNVAPALRAAFAQQQLVLSEASVLVVLAPGSQWQIDDTDTHVRYLVRKQGAALRVLRLPAAAGLPALFRAVPIRSLLPVLPDPPLPDIDVATLINPPDEPARPWQPVLPGALRYLLANARSGVLLAARSQLLRQGSAGDPALVSGSVPVQHRVPRPVPLPPNVTGREAFALRTWPSFFAPAGNVLASAEPVDEAFYADTRSRGPRRLRLRLLGLPRGTIPAQWDGQLLFEQLSEAGLSVAGAVNAVTLLAAGEKLAYAPVVGEPLFTIANIIDEEGQVALGRVRAALAPFGIALSGEAQLADASDDASEAWRLTDSPLGTELRLARRIGARADTWDVGALNARHCAFRPADPVLLRRQIAALGTGTAAIVQVRVRPADADGFAQTLSFALRGGNATAQPLPLDPHTIHFEDPEYNRALATQAGLAQRMIKLTKSAAPREFGLATISLASDRRSYNSYSPLALRYDWDDEQLQGTSLRITFTRLRANGAADELVRLNGDAAIQEKATPGALVQLSLSDLRVKQTFGDPLDPTEAFGGSLALQPDDRLLITLAPITPPGSWGIYSAPMADALPILVQLAVDIVAEPVIPAPEAAYALLRRQLLNGRDEVECARFAWGPDASRIELVSKDDLVLGVVRRRAVFQWRDVVRRGVLRGYAIQKIAQNGATHIPLEWQKGDKATR